MNTVTIEDESRIAEIIYNEQGSTIKDRDSFDLAFSNTIGDPSSAQEKLRDAVFRTYRDQHPEVSKERLFTKAGGKDLEQDRKTRAKKIVRTREGYVISGASQSDLEGFDTPQKRKRPAERKLQQVGKIKNKVVFVEKINVTIKGKSFVRYRDSKGRFASIKTKR